MWGYVTAWVWLLLSLTMVGVLAVAVVSIPTPPSAPDSRGPQVSRSPRPCASPLRSRKLGHDTRTPKGSPP